MKAIILFSSLLLFTTKLYSQIFEDIEIDEMKVSDWYISDMNDYEGVYFFGISEAESQVIVSIDKDIVCVQVQNFDWVKIDDETSDWRPRYVNYTNCRIVGNNFYSDETEGKFVLYNNGEEVIKGLKLDTPPNNHHNKYEIGELSKMAESEHIDGNYILTKFKIISIEELNKYTIKELQIMRNEIFARYNYVFIKDGEMDKYFRSKKWYLGLFYDVEQFLTEIEKVNIKNIKQIEEKKNNQ